MSKSLTTLISNVQAFLLDDGTRFSTATVTAAVRAALKEFNQTAPIHAGTLVDTVAEQYEYALNTVDFVSLIDVEDVLLQGTDTALDENTPLSYNYYFEDASPLIRLREPQPADKFLIVRFSIPYTVNGLDSATESTIPAFYDDILIDGACFYACQIRSVGRVEPINLNAQVSKQLAAAMPIFRTAFDKGLALMASKAPPVSEPSTEAWNDSYHEWNV